MACGYSEASPEFSCWLPEHLPAPSLEFPLWSDHLLQEASAAFCFPFQGKQAGF